MRTLPARTSPPPSEPSRANFQLRRRDRLHDLGKTSPPRQLVHQHVDPPPALFFKPPAQNVRTTTERRTVWLNDDCKSAWVVK